jgi:hypothetical protein
MLGIIQSLVLIGFFRLTVSLRGGGAYACWRIGLAWACPHEPDEGRREGSLVKSAAAPEASVPFAPVDRRWAGRITSTVTLRTVTRCRWSIRPVS